MEFQFGKYTEITDFAFENNPEYKTGGYIRFFICPDVTDFWLVRIMKDMNAEYEQEKGTFLMEREMLAKDYRGEKLTVEKVREIVKNDTFENWDIQESDSLEELIGNIDDGFGILELKN